MPEDLYLLGFYVPEQDLEKVLDAVFAAGAGRYRDYNRCAWTAAGEGRFRPLDGSHPAIGKANTDTRIKEIKVECIVSGERIAAVRKALIGVHPYEEPAFHFVALAGL